MSNFLFYSTYINFLKLKQSKLEQLVDSVKNAQICRGIESAGSDKAVVEINNVMQTEIGLSLDDPCFKELNSMPLGLEIPDSFMIHSTISWFADIVDILSTITLYESLKDRFRLFLAESIFELMEKPMDSIIECYRNGCSKEGSVSRQSVFETACRYHNGGLEEKIEEIIAYVILEKYRTTPWFRLLLKYLDIMVNAGKFNYLRMSNDRLDYRVNTQKLLSRLGFGENDGVLVLLSYDLDYRGVSIIEALDDLRYFSYRDFRHWDCMYSATRLTMGFYAYLLNRMATLSESDEATENDSLNSGDSGKCGNNKTAKSLNVKWPEDWYGDESYLWNSINIKIKNEPNRIKEIFKVLVDCSFVDNTQENLDLLVCFLTRRKTCQEIKPITWRDKKESLCYFIGQVAYRSQGKWKRSEKLFKYLDGNYFSNNSAAKNAESPNVNGDFKVKLKKAIGYQVIGRDVID